MFCIKHRQVVLHLVVSDAKCISVVHVPVWKTWQIILNFKFHQMSKKIKKFNFPTVYSCFNERKAISPIETE